jgi:hypothetical protein
MPTTTALSDRVCQVTGLAETGTDRTQVLGYLNQAYATSVMEAGAYTSTFSTTLTENVDDYTFGIAPLGVTNLLELRHLWVDDAALSNRPLVRVPEYEIQAMRQAQTVSSTPLYYAVRGNQQLLLFPAPMAGTTLSGVYLATPPTLVESAPDTGEETTPSAIPAVFHWDVLANKAISLAMEFDNRFEESAMFDQKWALGMERYLAYVGRFGGPSIHSIGDLSYDGPRSADTG